MAGADPAKMIGIFSPGGVEQFFRYVIAPPTPNTNGEHVTKAMSLAGKYDVELLPPPTA